MQKVSKTVMCTAPYKLEWKEIEELPLNENHFKVRSQFGAAKHGTELTFYRGKSINRGTFDEKLGLWVKGNENLQDHYPITIGNMLVGTITELGRNVTKFKVGDQILTFGGFQQTHTIFEENPFIWKMPSGLSWKSAVCLDPSYYALGALRESKAGIGDAVAVFGMGAISLILIQMLKLAGVTLILAVDPLANRRETALKLGANVALDPTSCDVGLEIRKLTKQRGADVSIEFSGTRQGLQSALRSTARGGNVIIGAWCNPFDGGLDLGAEAHVNCLNILLSQIDYGHREYPRWDSARTYETCWKLITEGKIRAEEIVQPVVKFSDLLTEYPKIDTDPLYNIKLGVEFDS